MSSVVVTRRSVLSSGSLVNSGNEYEPRVRMFQLLSCEKCGNEFDGRCSESCLECGNGFSEKNGPLVLRDCIDTVADKLAERVQHSGGRLASFEEEIEMELSEDFTAAPLIVRVRRDGFEFECSLKSVLRNPWRLQSGTLVVLKYSLETV